MVDTTFYFTTFEVKGSFGLDRDTTQDRDEAVEEVLREYVSSDNSVVVTPGGIKWYFGAPDPYPNYILGKFGKVYADEAETYDEEKGDFVELDEPNTEADYSYFILHFDYNLLIYHTKNRIGHKMFRNQFAAGFASFTPGSLEIEIEFIKNEDDIETVLEEYPVKAAGVELQPSNPHPGPAWEELDNHIQEMLASRLEIDIESIEDGSLRVDEELLEQILAMSQTEYGSFRVAYVDDGNQKVITSNPEDYITDRGERPNRMSDIRQRTSDLIEYAQAFI